MCSEYSAVVNNAPSDERPTVRVPEISSASRICIRNRNLIVRALSTIIWIVTRFFEIQIFGDLDAQHAKVRRQSNYTEKNIYALYVGCKNSTVVGVLVILVIR